MELFDVLNNEREPLNYVKKLMKNNGEIVPSVLQRYEIIKDEIEW